MSHLKPCPFCGENVRFCGGSEAPFGCGPNPCSRIICDNCGEFIAFDGMGTESTAAAARLWNRRVNKEDAQ